MTLNADFLFRVHLPRLMRHSRVGRLDARPTTSGGWRQAGLGEPPLERTLGGDGRPGCGLEQVDADQARAPSGMFPAQSQGRPDHLGELSLVGCGLRIIGGDGPRTPLSKPRDEPTNRRAWQSERRGDLWSFPTLLPEPEDGLTDG